MAHYDLTSGDERLTEHDLAMEILKHIEQKDFVIVKGEKTDKGVRLIYSNKDKKIPRCAGNYLIYSKDGLNQYDALYAGESGRDIEQRIRRELKELAGKSRPDESHSAAKKMRQLGIMRYDDEHHIRYIKEIEKKSIVADILCEYLNIDMKNIDEHIAHLAGAKFNKKVKKA